MTEYHTSENAHPPHQNVYHDRDNCPDGRRIKRKMPGRGNRRKCRECVKMARAEFERRTDERLKRVFAKS
jgi:hypothetical protein